MVMTTKIPLAVALTLGDEDIGMDDAAIGRLTRWLFSPDDGDFPVMPFIEEAEGDRPELVKAFARLREHAETDFEEVRDAVVAEVRKSLNRLSQMEADTLDEQVMRLQRGARALICPDAALAEISETAALADADEKEARAMAAQLDADGLAEAAAWASADEEGDE